MSSLPTAARIAGFFVSVSCIVGATLLSLRGVTEAASWTGSHSSDIAVGVFLFAIGLALLWMASRSKAAPPVVDPADEPSDPGLPEEEVAEVKSRLEEADDTRRGNQNSREKTVPR